MGHAEGYIIKFSEDRYGVFKQRSEIGFDRFAEPVHDFQHTRIAPLICFILSPDKTITHIARGRRGYKAGTELRRLNIEDAKALSQVIPSLDIIKRIPNNLRNYVINKFENGGLLTTKGFQTVVDIIRNLSPETRPILDLFSKEHEALIEKLSEKTRQVLSFQKETVATALKLAGLPIETLQYWKPPVVAEPQSFLEGLHEARFREDSMVINDLMKLPGYGKHHYQI